MKKPQKMEFSKNLQYQKVHLKNLCELLTLCRIELLLLN